MGRKVEKTTIDAAIDYFVKNNVRFIDISEKFKISTSTISQHLKKRGIKVDSQRTRRGRSSWNSGKNKYSDTRVAKNAKSLSDAKTKTGLRSGYQTIYVDELKKRIRLHEYVWFKNTGVWPDGKNREQVHHIDGDKLNNDFDNLLLVKTDEHSKIHKEYEIVFLKLLKLGLIKFDKIARGVDWRSFEELIKKLKV